MKEGEKSDKLFIIKEGQCALYKTMEIKDMLGVLIKRQEKIMDLDAGEMFGEDFICFAKENNYSIKAISTKVVCLAIK